MHADLHSIERHSVLYEHNYSVVSARYELAIQPSFGHPIVVEALLQPACVCVCV